ncbi:MAG: 7-cyano-7-deazaguanine synthase QueC [Phycisphaera sp.]|nr:MAG: 7-cyano-7-deazaguanine synthase QueC [Phycisphaera sp.]
MQPMAVVLLSGGLDSATCLAIARRDGFNATCLAVDYGQRHRCELDAARQVAASFDAELRTVRVDLRAFGGSALTDDLDVPKGRSEQDISGSIPVTYVPARNLVFLSLAVAQAEVLGAQYLYIGVNQLDYSGYPDCRGEFIESFRVASNLATKAGVEGKPLRISTPLIDLTKAEIVTLGTSLGVDYALTVSCYDPTEDGLACGSCDSCQLRRRGFDQANLRDPTRYA